MSTKPYSIRRSIPRNGLVPFLAASTPKYLEVPQEVLDYFDEATSRILLGGETRRPASWRRILSPLSNNELKDMLLIRAGNERVLAARLADAQFLL